MNDSYSFNSWWYSISSFISWLLVLSSTDISRYSWEIKREAIVRGIRIHFWDYISWLYETIGISLSCPTTLDSFRNKWWSWWSQFCFHSWAFLQNSSWNAFLLLNKTIRFLSPKSWSFYSWSPIHSLVTHRLFDLFVRWWKHTGHDVGATVTARKHEDYIRVTKPRSTRETSCLFLSTLWSPWR